MTPLSRTIVDLADVVSARTLRQVLERTEILRLDCNPAPIPGRRGYGRLARALAEHRPALSFTRSQLERVFLAICREAGLPKPLANATIDGMEVDFCWPERRLVVEIDSWKFHGGRTAHRRDRRRSTALLLVGWTVVRFTDEDVELDRDYILATLAKTGV